MGRIGSLVIVPFVLLACAEKTPVKPGPEVAVTASASVAPEPAPVGPRAAPDAAPSASAVASEVRAPRFVIPIPAGYEEPPPAMRAEMTKQTDQQVDAILIKPRKQPEHFLTSIVVAKIGGTDTGAPTLALCTEVSSAIVKASGGKVIEKPKMVKLPFGETCQHTIAIDKQHAIQAIAYLGADRWMITCNYDARDADSPKECQQVLEGFRAVK